MLLPLQQPFSRPLTLDDHASNATTSPGGLPHPAMAQGAFPLVSFPAAGEDVEDESLFSTDDQASSQDDSMFLGMRSPSSLAGALAARSPDKKEAAAGGDEDEYEDAAGGEGGHSPGGQTYQELY